MSPDKMEFLDYSKAKSPWIDVKVRMPFEEELILAFSNDGYFIGYWICNAEDEIIWKEKSSHETIENITYWMPLANAPK
jgi:hypothetical protein